MHEPGSVFRIHPPCESMIRLQCQTTTTSTTSWRAAPTSIPHPEETLALSHLTARFIGSSVRAGAWFPHTSHLTQGSLTVTYVRGDRSVVGKIQFCSALMETDHIWNSKKYPWQWCYDTPSSCRATIYVLKVQYLRPHRGGKYVNAELCMH